MLVHHTIHPIGTIPADRQTFGGDFDGSILTIPLLRTFEDSFWPITTRNIVDDVVAPNTAYYTIRLISTPRKKIFSTDVNNEITMISVTAFVDKELV